ncbi:proline racemase family protein [Pelomonas sp. KK5]|uniref:proline racemase family protein n=1 Tax=Pelomonas sp. KK5 TaxID=1855730 RepID=UPI00097C999E|nr:proline racemase family protein [Pelomonas sp. KK5]
MTSPTRIIDSHTGGEPTRVIVSGGPELGRGTMAERLAVFKARHDRWRSAVVNEPRGSDVIVGALLCEPVEPDSTAGVIFFNNVGYLGMCGHGTIGLVATLAHLGRIGPGEHRIETPVGRVGATLHEDGRVSVANVPAWREQANVAVTVDGRTVHGDIAWGGNWFFLCADHGIPLDLAHQDELLAFAWALRQQLPAHIDHVELTGPAHDAANSGRNYVLCPGKAYDRSPCGTGTSAKLACLAAEGKLAPGQRWRQESVIGSVFEASYRIGDREGQVLPTITGRAFVNLDAALVFQDGDPFAWGIST